jgi:hypothetical protein
MFGKSFGTVVQICRVSRAPVQPGPRRQEPRHRAPDHRLRYIMWGSGSLPSESNNRIQLDLALFGTLFFFSIEHIITVGAIKKTDRTTEIITGVILLPPFGASVLTLIASHPRQGVFSVLVYLLHAVK